MTDRADPAELARRHGAGDVAGPSLHEYPDRPHNDEDWSMRSALVRYAQPEPVRASALLELVRRTESGLRDVEKRIEREPALSDLARAYVEGGERFVDAYEAAGGVVAADARSALPVLAVAARLDALGGVLADWAVDAGPDRPDADVDAVCREVNATLDALGVEREDWYR